MSRDDAIVEVLVAAKMVRTFLGNEGPTSMRPDESIPKWAHDYLIALFSALDCYERTR